MSLRKYGVPFPVALLVLMAAPASLAFATSPPPPTLAPCSGPQWKALDFWIGEWDASWPASPGTPAGSGTNRIEKILDGCVVSEHFAGSGPGALEGKSYSTWNPQRKVWLQTWVDNQASYLDFIGDMSKPDEKIFAMERTGRDGKSVRLRMVFHHITPDSFDWRWEKSSDGGKTWQVQWPIHYTRKKP